MWGGEYATVRVHDPPSALRSQSQRDIAYGHASSPVVLHKCPGQKMHFRMILLLSQSIAIASAVCVRGKNNTGVTAMWGPPSPTLLFYIWTSILWHPAGPRHILPSSTCLLGSPQALGEYFCFPWSVGKARLRRQCQGGGRRDALPFPSVLAFEIARCAHCLSSLHSQVICSSAIILLTAWEAYL